MSGYWIFDWLHAYLARLGGLQQRIAVIGIVYCMWTCLYSLIQSFRSFRFRIFVLPSSKYSASNRCCRLDAALVFIRFEAGYAPQTYCFCCFFYYFFYYYYYYFLKSYLQVKRLIRSTQNFTGGFRTSRDLRVPPLFSYFRSLLPPFWRETGNDVITSLFFIRFQILISKINS